jgi:hypothetical protein
MFRRNSRNLKLGVVYRYGDHQTSQPSESFLDGLPNWFYFTDNTENVQNDGSGFPALRFQAGIWNPQKVLSAGTERVPVIICSTSQHQAGTTETPWTDVIDLIKSEAIYYGDNKPPANPNASLVRGNSEMLRAFELHNSDRLEDRLNAPPVILVSTRDENGPKSGYKVVEGLCLIERYELIEQMISGQLFSNYEFHLRLLDLELDDNEISMDWIHARRDSDVPIGESSSYAPKCWQDFIQKGIKHMNTTSKNSSDSNEAFEINIRPETSALKLFKSMDFTPWYALGEFVDNSITSSIKNLVILKGIYGDDYRLKVDIWFDSDSNSLSISDNAAGISRSDFERAMRTSEPPPDTSVGLGLHGVGMKASAFWWGESLEIETNPINETTGWQVRIDLSEIDMEESGDIGVTPIERVSESGTVVRIGKLWNGVPRYKTPSTIKRYLSSIYRSYIDSSMRDMTGLEMELRFQGELLSYKAPELLVAPFWPDSDGPKNGSPEIFWRKEIVIELESGQKISGWFGILNRMSRDLSGFFLHYRGKGVAGVNPNPIEGEVKEKEISREGGYKPQRIFGQSGSYADQSFIGEFDVSAFGKTITTDSVMWTVEQESEFIEKLTVLMKSPTGDYFKQAQNMRRRKASTTDLDKDQRNTHLITEQISSHLDQLGMSHGAVENQEISFEIENLEKEDKPVAFSISDKEGHFHQFELIVTVARETALISVVEDLTNKKHTIVVNKNHISFDKFPPIQGELRQMLLLFCLSIGIAEVFLDGPERDRLRNKFNEVIEKYGSELN